MNYSIAFGIAAFIAFLNSLWGIWYQVTDRSIYFLLLAILFQLCAMNNNRRKNDE